MTRVEALPAIVEKLEHYATRLERCHDSRCVFTKIYALLTLALGDAVSTRRWEDARWVETLAAHFSARYLAALDAFDLGEDPGPAWSTLQTTMRSVRSSVLQDLLAGMIGHIVHDLPYALEDARLSDDAGRSHIADYHAVNDVLADQIEPFRTLIERRYNPWLRWLDWLGRTETSILTSYGIRLSRAAAWYNANRLLDPVDRARAAAALEKSPLVSLDQIFRSPIPVVRQVVRAFDVAISLGRRWPQSPLPDLPRPAETPSQRYYFTVGAGTWRGEFHYRITGWRAFWAAKLGFKNRALALAMSVVMGVFQKARIDSEIEAYPDQNLRGVATNLVRISLLGITLYLLREQYALGADGESVYVRSYERFGPFAWLLNVEKGHPAKVTERGAHATYWIPLLGADWIGEYDVAADQKRIESVLSCAWARATESIEKLP